MKVMRLLAAGLVLLALNAHARTSVPIVDHEAVPAVRASAQPATADQILAAMQAAGPLRGWQITPAGPGKALAVLSVRGKHSITVDIAYTSGKYSLKYRDSVNMNYAAGEGLGSIHPKYNTWVQTLMDDIRLQLLKP